MEIWKDIIGYEGYYAISSQGRIKSIQREVASKNGLTRIVKERILKLLDDNRGRHYVVLWKDHQRENFRVHRLVAEYFIPNPENKPQVNHLNGIPTDNRAENLEWCTNKENAEHASRTGLANGNYHTGEKHGRNKLTEEDYDIIQILLDSKQLTQKEIAKIFNVSKSLIWAFNKKIIWKHRFMNL